MKTILKPIVAMIFVFAAPALVAVGAWAFTEHPQSWRDANWSSAGVLPEASGNSEAVVYVMSARTGGLKGALVTHSWLVTKAENETTYTRYDKVGWGSPIRKNAYDADGRWYSNEPMIVHAVYGQNAGRLIPKIEAAIASYPFSSKGGYRIWPGPNSNTFVAHVLRAVPELNAQLPPEAVGRDYPSEGQIFWMSNNGLEYRFSLWGYAGFAAGVQTGLEFNLAGLVLGIDIMRPALKIPGFGRVGFAAI